MDTSARVRPAAAGRPPAMGLAGVLRRGFKPGGPGRALPDMMGVMGTGVLGTGVVRGTPARKGGAVFSRLRRALDGLVPSGGQRRAPGDGLGI